MAIRDLSYLACPVAVATTDPLCYIPTGFSQVLGIQVTNNGANALDAFEIAVRTGKSAVWTTIASAAGDFTGASYPILYHSTSSGTSPVTLAASGTSLIVLQSQGFLEVRLSASIGTTASTVDVHVTQG